MPRMTLQVRLVLRALADEPAEPRYGLQIVDATGLLPGTIYPILARLEQADWLRSEWEDVDEHAAGRPRRRYYRLTADGLAAARAAAEPAARRGAAPRRFAAGGTGPGRGAAPGRIVPGTAGGMC